MSPLSWCWLQYRGLHILTAMWLEMIITLDIKRWDSSDSGFLLFLTWEQLSHTYLYIYIYIIFYMNAFTSSWQPNELIFYGHFLLLLSSICVSNGDWSCLFAFSVDSASLHLHQPSPSFLPFSFALLWASHKPVLRRQMITSYRQPPQQAIAALAVAVLTKAKDVMGHRDTATRSILRAGSGIRGNRSREEGVG